MKYQVILTWRECLGHAKVRESLAELNQMPYEIMSVKVVVAGEENSLKGDSRVHGIVLCGSGKTGLEQLLQMEG